MTYVVGLRAGLSAVGIESRVFTPNPGESVGSDVVDVRKFGPSPFIGAACRLYESFTRRRIDPWWRGRRLAAALRHTLRDTHLDLLEMEESLGTAWHLRRRSSLPIVVRLHGPWLAVAPAMGLTRDANCIRREHAEGRAIKAADGVSSPSRHCLQQVREHYGIDLPDAEVIPNPTAIPEPGSGWTYDSCDKRSILFVGRFDRLKGGDIVIDAFKQIAEERPEAELIFVGMDRGVVDGAGRTRSLAEYLSDRLSPAQIARVHQLGQQPQSSIGELRRKALVTIVASRFESFSMTALEALSFGCPLVASDVGGIPEIVVDEENGLLFKDGDSTGLARQVLRIFRDPQLAQRLGKHGARDAAERYAPTVVGRQTGAFYARVCAKGRG
ncbi:MAG TPA: glycosyltransferase family 4 protein [Planctomycetota bacterium]|nr:glycosyltransferase family 4 protein [Planctomycetota bacterium]